MKKRWIALGLALFLSIVFVLPAKAILLSFEPASQIVPVGEPVSVDLVISGLEDYTAPSLGAFDLDIHFDPTILAFDSATFGDPVLGDQLDIWGLGLNPMGTIVPVPGVLDIWEVSLDTPDDLNNFQVGSFTLATLTFSTLTVGASSLEIIINSLADAYGNPLSADAQSGVIAPVPEPATFILIGFGLGGIGILRRRKII